MSVVSRNCSADRNLAPSSIAAHCKQIPNPKSQIPSPNVLGNPNFCLGFGFWDLGIGISRYDRQDDWTADYRADDDVSAHVQAEGGGELSVRESPDVPEVPRQAGTDARRERGGEVRSVRAVLGGVPGGCHLSRGGGERRHGAGGSSIREGVPDSQDALHFPRLLRGSLSCLGDLYGQGLRARRLQQGRFHLGQRGSARPAAGQREGASCSEPLVARSTNLKGSCHW